MAAQTTPQTWEPKGGSYRFALRTNFYSRPVRLGEGVVLDGSLCGEAIEHTLRAWSVSASKIERHGVRRAQGIRRTSLRPACRHWRRIDGSGRDQGLRAG